MGKKNFLLKKWNVLSIKKGTLDYKALCCFFKIRLSGAPYSAENMVAYMLSLFLVFLFCKDKAVFFLTVHK